MSRIDETRDNIRTRKLSDNERKQMFEKFVSHGGELINERPKRYRQFDREKQRQYRDKIEEHKHKLRNKKKKSPSSFSQSSDKDASSPASSLNPLLAYFHLVRIRFNLFVRGVTDGSGRNIKAKFIKHFNNEYKSAVMQLQLVYIELFRNIDYERAQKIIDKLDAMKPLYFELIEMGADVYDREVTGQIIDEYIVFDQQFFSTSSMAPPFIEYFKRIYLLYNYQTTLMTAYDKAFESYSRMVKNGMTIPDQRRRTKNSIYVVFNKLFPKLYWLFCYYNRRIVSPFDYGYIDEILSISPEMKPGTRVPNSPSRLKSEIAIKTRRERDSEEAQMMQDAKDELKRNAAPKISQEVRRGLVLMQEINYDSLAVKYLKNILRNANYHEQPMVKAYLVIQEFDEEYSIIFTTNKIKIALPHDRRTETDYKVRLSELYNGIRHVDDEYRNYFAYLDNYEEASKDKPLSQTQYMSYSKRLGELEKGVKKKEAILRKLIREYLISVIESLEVLAADMESKQRIVLNPQDEIEFDVELEGDKKLRGKKIYQSIQEVIDFASAFLHRLSGNNDLSAEKALMARHNQDADDLQPAEVSEAVPEQQPSSDDGGEERSVLEELDSLL